MLFHLHTHARLDSSKYFCQFPSFICVLVCHVFVEPAPFFQQDQIQTAFVLYIVPVNTSVSLNWRESITCLSNRQQHNTKHATQNTVTLNQYKTAFYGTHSINHQSALICNQINNEAPSDLLQKSRSEIREYTSQIN